MSTLLVAIQFALILLLLLPLPENLSSASLVSLAAGVLLGLWTVCHNRIGNFNIRPEPKAGGQLVTTGPYRRIRHPMYTVVLLVMAPFALSALGPLKVVLWVSLFAVLLIKSSIEERLLKQRFAEYARYKQTAGRFLPRLFGKPELH